MVNNFCYPIDYRRKKSEERNICVVFDDRWHLLPCLGLLLMIRSTVLFFLSCRSKLKVKKKNLGRFRHLLTCTLRSSITQNYSLRTLSLNGFLLLSLTLCLFFACIFLPCFIWHLTEGFRVPSEKFDFF